MFVYLYLLILAALSTLLYFLAGWKVAVLVAGIIITVTNLLLHFFADMLSSFSSTGDLMALVGFRYVLGLSLFLTGIIALAQSAG